MLGPHLFEQNMKAKSQGWDEHRLVVADWGLGR